MKAVLVLFLILLTNCSTQDANPNSAIVDVKCYSGDQLIYSASHVRTFIVSDSGAIRIEKNDVPVAWYIGAACVETVSVEDEKP